MCQFWPKNVSIVLLLHKYHNLIIETIILHNKITHNKINIYEEELFHSKLIRNKCSFRLDSKDCVNNKNKMIKNKTILQ